MNKLELNKKMVLNILNQTLAHANSCKQSNIVFWCKHKNGLLAKVNDNYFAAIINKLMEKGLMAIEKEQHPISKKMVDFLVVTEKGKRYFADNANNIPNYLKVY